MEEGETNKQTNKQVRDKKRGLENMKKEEDAMRVAYLLFCVCAREQQTVVVCRYYYLYVPLRIRREAKAMLDLYMLTNVLL